MSAIAGIYHLDGKPVERWELDNLTGALAHRGPDGSGRWSHGSVGLIHQMLQVTPESLGERLPLGEGSFVVTADARLDNRAELCAELASDRPPVEVSDGLLILRAYQRWTTSAPERLLGDFAFAIWDQQRQWLFAARDHFGVKPFYYYSSPGLFAFATEIKALRALPGVPSRLNELRVADHLVAQRYDTWSTFFQDILRLPPGHQMVISREGVKLSRYWSLDPARELRLRSDGEYAEALRALFAEAVRCRLRRAFPAGSMLSGGLDSSSVTCMARRLAQEGEPARWHTFSAIHDLVRACDESEHIAAVLAQGGFEPHFFRADRVSPLIDLDRVVWHQDEPSFGGNLYIDWGLYGPARDHGLRVLLDGFDGDSTISHGVGYLVELASAKRWLPLAREVFPYARAVNESGWRAFGSWLWRYELEPRWRSSRVLRRARRFRLPGRGAPAPTGPWWWGAVVHSDFARRVGLLERRSLAGPPPRTEREQHLRRLTDPGVPATLEALDHAAAAFSIEVRFPFWDKRLVEFCLALPPEQKIRRGWTRLVMRHAMEGILPPTVQWRPGKVNHHAGFEQGLLRFERDLLDDVILRSPEVIVDFVDLSVLRTRYARCLSGQSTADDLNSIWQVVSLALWLRRSGLRP